MIRVYQKMFVLFLVFFCCSNYSFAGFPPVEIIAHLKEYEISSAKLLCNVPQKDSEFRDKIRKSYSCLYSTQSTIDSLNLESIKERYLGFVHLEFSHEYGIISVSFNVKEFVKAFSFDTDLVRKTLKENGFIPLVVEYSIDCIMKSLTSTDEMIHKIVFDGFYGGNLILKENSSKVFMHLQDKLMGNPGQMILTDQKQEAVDRSRVL